MPYLINAIPYIDIHTHRVRAGVRGIVSCSALSSALPPAGTLFSVGIHPWDADGLDAGQLADTLVKMRRLPASAIGEIGLDYARNVDKAGRIDGANKAAQQSVFRAQLELAAAMKLPVILHCVKAYNDMLAILSDFSLPAVIFHGYIGSARQTATIAARGYYMSFGQRSLRSPKTVESLIVAPDHLIFAETDSEIDSDIYAAMDSEMNADADNVHPANGTREARIEDIYVEIAVTKGVSTSDLAAIIYTNFTKVFK